MRNGPRSSVSSSLCDSSQLGRLSWFCWFCWEQRDDEDRETDDGAEDDDGDEVDECTRTLTLPLPSPARRVSNEISSAPRPRSDSAASSELNSSFVQPFFDLSSSRGRSTSISICETAVDEEDEGLEDERARGRPAQSNSQSSAFVEPVDGRSADGASNEGWTSRKDDAVGRDEVVEDVEEETREGSAQRSTCG